MYVLYKENFCHHKFIFSCSLFPPYNTLWSGNQSYSGREKWKGCSLSQIMLHFFLLFLCFTAPHTNIFFLPSFLPPPLSPSLFYLLPFLPPSFHSFKWYFLNSCYFLGTTLGDGDADTKVSLKRFRSSGRPELSWLCTSLPSSTFSDTTLVPWKWLWWEYLHHGHWQVL